MDIIRKYPLDVSGRSPDNLVIQEPHDLVETPTSDYRVLIPNYGGFYTDSLRVYDESMNPLPVADFISTYLYEDATELTALEVCGAVVIKNPNVSRRVYIDYQVVGGNYAMSTDALRQVLEVLDNNNRPVDWKAIIGRPTQFPVGGHLHALWELYGFEYMTTQLERITQAILAGNQATMDELRDYAYALYQDGKAYTDALDDRFRDHKADYTNPHQVTKAQVGLGLVENYRIATNNEIETGSSTSLYLTVAGVVHAIEYHLGRDFTAHVNDIGNPHQVTKAQVGLGSVENYSPSTKSQAEVGTVNNRYMTPLRTAEAITHQIGNAFDSHTSDYTNPHRVTKAQVGLGSVQNHGLSNKNEAELGDRNDRYMTPLRTSEAITYQIGNAFDAHTGDFGNPHQVTKSQVGLGIVQNYGISSKAEAEAGNRTDRYMTPLRVKEAIDFQVGDSFENHVADMGNPHQVTKAQVGLGNVDNYSTATKAQAEAGVLATRFMTPLRTADAIKVQAIEPLNAHAALVNNPHSVTKAQVGLGSVENYGIASRSEAEVGDINDRYMTPLRVKEAVRVQAVIPANAHAALRNNPHNVTKAQVGLGSVDNYSTASKGEAEAGTANNRFMTPLRVKEAIEVQAIQPLNSHVSQRNNPHQVTKAQVGLGNVENYLISTQDQAEVGTVNTRYMTPLRTADAIKVQAIGPLNAHAALVNNPHNVTKAQVGLGNVENYLIATQAQAEVGVLNTRYMTPLRTAQAITEQAGSLLDTHIRDNNNPHGVTKAQVGLGSVADYGIATLSEARDGTVHNKYMTPLRTAQAITTQVGTTLSSHISNTSNPHSVTKAQVGLGNVDNYNVATQAEAEAGSFNTRYMTPLRTRQAINKFAGDLVDAHANRTNNPHSVTKAQVGLGNVENYSIATQAIAVSATANNYYMTPLRTRQAFGPSFQSHVINGFSMPRTGATSRIDFGSFKSDHGYIEHIVTGSDSPGEARFRFCVSDDAIVGVDTDRFEFGAMNSQNNNAWVNWMQLNSDRMWLSRDLYTVGNISANNVQFRSDMRYKDDVSPLTDVFEKIQQLSGFDYRLILDNERYTGLSAQEVQQVLPHSVREVKGSEGEEHLTVNLAGPVALLVEVVKELIDTSREKDKVINQLEERLQRIETLLT